jgi:hypothetical protein
LALDADGSDGETRGAKRSAGKREETDFLLFRDTRDGGENQLRGSLGKTNVQRGGSGIIGENQMMIFDFLAKSDLPVFAGLRFKIGILKKLQAQRASQIGNRGNAVGKLANRIVERSVSRSETREWE